MWSLSPIFFVLVLLLGVWIAMSREIRVAVHGYLLQTGLVALLYGLTALQTKDPMVYVALCGLVVLRLGLIPWLLRRFLRGALYTSRKTNEVFSPAHALVVYILLAAIGITTGQRGLPGILGLDLGIAVAVLLVGLATVTIAHHAPKQVMGILAADNGIDLAVVLTLRRIPVVADYAIFLDVTVAVLCLTLMVLRLSTYGSEHAHHFNELKG